MTPERKAQQPSWADFRSRMPVCAKWAYFDHAAVAPLPRDTSDRIIRWARQAARDGVIPWADWMREVEQLRSTAARLTGAAPEEIAFIPNTTTGIGLIAEGYPWQAGDNVVTLANEFPSNLYPWLNLQSRGVEVRQVEVDRDGAVDVDRLRAACDRRTRIVSLSWVGYASGFRLDLAQITQCVHEQGALFFLDAIQGLGVFPLNVQAIPIDFFAADGHKWMLGPEGAGLLYLRQNHLDLLRPLGVGWNSVRQRFDFSRTKLDLRLEAARYEGGTLNTAGLLGLGTSLSMLENFGLAADASSIADRVLEYAAGMTEGLRTQGAEVREFPERNRSGIVRFTVPTHSPDAVRRFLRQQNVIANCRGGMVRVSPHAYNDAQDLQRLSDALDQLAASSE